MATFDIDDASDDAGALLLHKGEGRTRVSLSVRRLGRDFIVCLFNDAAHIGAVAVADYSEKERRASVSVLTRLGHKEDALAAEAARGLCKATRRPVCAIAGIHLADITQDEIARIIENCQKLLAVIRLRLTAADS